MRRLWRGFLLAAPRLDEGPIADNRIIGTWGPMPDSAKREYAEYYHARLPSCFHRWAYFLDPKGEYMITEVLGFFR